MEMDRETLKKKAFEAFVEITNAVDGGETIILEEWRNKTQVIELFLKKGKRKNYLLGFNIQDAYRGVSFTPTYKQIATYLSALDTWQFKFKKGDEGFWLGVAFGAFMALSKRDECYNDILDEIYEKTKNKEMDKKKVYDHRKVRRVFYISFIKSNHNLLTHLKMYQKKITKKGRSPEGRDFLVGDFL